MASFLTKLAENSKVPEIIFSAIKSGVSEQEIVKKIVTEIKDTVESNSYDATLWTTAFIDELAKLLYKVYKVRTN